MQTPRYNTDAHRNARMGGNEDPLEAIQALGSDGAKVGALLGFAVAVALHGVGAAQAYSIPVELQRWASDARAHLRLSLATIHEIEVEKEPPPPPPEPAQQEPEPEPAKEPEPPKPVQAPKPPTTPKAEPRAKAAPPKEEPAPAAAQAGKVLTQEPDPNEPVDLTGQGFVTGNAETYAGGVTASAGTSKTAVYDPNARPDGVPGGKGKGPAPASPGPDRSRPARPAETTWASCAFPPEADAEQIDFQLVTIMVTVRPDGTPQSVKVVNDPGRGFGRAARQCAMSKKFLPALDRNGQPILATTPPFTVKFER